MSVAALTKGMSLWFPEWQGSSSKELNWLTPSYLCFLAYGVAIRTPWLLKIWCSVLSHQQMWNDSLVPESSWVMGWTTGHCLRMLVELGWEMGKKWSMSKTLTWRQGLGRAWNKDGWEWDPCKRDGRRRSLCWAAGTQMADSLGSCSHWRNPPPHHSPLPDLSLVTTVLESVCNADNNAFCVCVCVFSLFLLHFDQVQSTRNIQRR